MKHLNLYIISIIFIILPAVNAVAQKKNSPKKESIAKPLPQKTKPDNQQQPKEPALLQPEKKDEKKDSQPKTERAASIRINIVLKVLNPDKVRTAIKNEALNLNGYPAYMGDSSIMIKIKPEKLEQALSLFTAHGVVIEKDLDRRDLTMEIAQLEGSLSSKEEILKKMRTFFDSSDLNSTLDIERNMNQIVNEIENIKGSLRVLKDSAKWSVIDIFFQFRERENIRYVSSPFNWLNSANTEDFLENF